MNTPCILIFVCRFISIGPTIALENLAQNEELRGVPIQSTSYPYRYFAKNAVNGKFENETEIIACSFTVGGDMYTRAWWKLPLTKLCNVAYLRIFFRSSTVNRHVGFSVHVFNDSSFVPPSTGSETIVFTQDTTTCPKQVINITVNRLTKGIALYNVKEPPLTTSCSGYSTFATIEICEVQVFGCVGENFGMGCQRCDSKCLNSHCDAFNGACIYGCSNPHKRAPDCSTCFPGYYGNDCIQTCGQCQGVIPCNSSSGECSEGCLDNWTGFHCDRCQDGYYGRDCNMLCNKCKIGTFCDDVTGNCPEGCEDKWRGSKCDTCQNGYYGMDCEFTCGKCQNKSLCDNMTGNCQFGCQDNWQGPLCKECKGGFYGPECTQRCGRCQNEIVCNNITGDCSQGCDEHWNGSRCDACQNGYYGMDCEFTCGKCQNKSLCDNMTGNCQFGCQDNWQGPLCKECKGGFYGPECTQMCGRCQNESVCNNITGDCSQGCDEHWNGSRCNVCSFGFYGIACNNSCGHCVNNSACDSSSGVCPEGCLAHWSGPKCNKCIDGLHGQNCTETCGNCKHGTVCNHITGVCKEGCDKYWNGSNCKVCGNGLYGEKCSMPCGKCEIGTFCNNVSGICPFGCQDKWQGSKCDKENSGSGVIVGVTLGTIAVGIIFCIVFMFLYIRRRQCKHHGSKGVLFSRFDIVKDDVKNIETEYVNISATAAESCPSEEQPSVENTYKNVVDTSIDINVNELQFVIEEKSKGEPNAFYTEYKRLPTGDTSRCLVAQLPDNKIQNRFKTTYPYDHSRVVLKEQWKDSDKDYINANYIKDFKDEKRYLATQGPMSKTSSDFWRMIWQEQVECIVMLTNLFEGGKNKCFKYWPDQSEHLQVGLCKISLLEEIKYACYTMRKLSIERTDTPMKRDIIQMHYTSWPDHGTPEELDLVQFHRAVMKRDKAGSPLLVHCSAGVGRTGTFIGYDALLTQGKETGRINVFEFVKKMRKDRMTMIQTKEQYAFLHKALACGFLGEGMVLKQTDLEIRIHQLLNDKSPQNQQALYKEYKLLSSLGPVLRDTSTKVENDATKPPNSGDDKHRVYLTSYIKGRSDYINAVVVPSYTDLMGFIMTTYPIPDTDIDLWRLCMDQEVDVITVFVSTKDIWWIPQRGKSGACPPYYITNQETWSDVRGVIQEQLVLTDQKNRRDITLFRINPDEEKHTLQGVRFLLEKNIREDVKTLVISKDNNRATGLFIVLYNVLQQLRLDKEVDVFTAVRRIQSRNPNVFTTLEEYRICYQMILDSVSEEVYANV